MGHLEINGFQMNKNLIHSHGGKEKNSLESLIQSLVDISVQVR